MPGRPMPSTAQGYCPNAGSIPPAPDPQGYFTMSNGCPLQDPLWTERVDKLEESNRMASQLIQDLNVVDTISHVTRERIPERYVHAKGTGAFGTFEVTNKDIRVSDYTDAKFLNATGKKTRLFSRFSTVAGERGYPDTVRDAKGAAFKLYTEEGNLDWAFLNPDIFMIRDPSKFPSLVHATKRDPASNLPDANMFWDYFNNHPEGYNALMRIFSDEGTPKSYSRIQISSVHCYTFTKKDNEGNWKHTLVRIKLVPDPPIDPDNDYFDLGTATTVAGKDPDWLGRRLYEEITDAHSDPMKKYPSWKVMAQIVEKPNISTVNIFDATKTLSEEQFPLEEFGKITLTECPVNFFTQVEQAGFNPANVVPGWDISPDPLLQIRLFAYGDTQRYRLGVNNDQLPTNRPCSYVWSPTRRDGAYNMTNYANARNYIRNDDNKKPPDNYNISFLKWTGELERFKSSITPVDYKQCHDHYYSMTPKLQSNFVTNVVASLSTAQIPTQDKSLEIFELIDHNLAENIKNALRTRIDENRELARTTLGVVAGAEHPHELGYVPPTVPDPATEVVHGVFEKV
ncbi:catalase [Talaromyces islandicus]|uniref:Catalase n=1 Tax=Talaromyces islandicus TaxID=28573 RepID=A0A0U1LIF0_TALIS|nr:catalase [Talaromyces islandicus]